MSDEQIVEVIAEGIDECVCAAWRRAAVGSEQLPCPRCEASTSLLTDDEREALAMTASLYNQLVKVVGDGPPRSHDLAELALHVHNIQHAVMAQAAARAYPDQYRLLGGGWYDGERGVPVGEGTDE